MSAPATRLTTQQQQIVERYLPLLNDLAANLARRLRCSSKDLLGPGYIGLIDAVLRFDRNINDDFQGFATKRIKGEMIDSVRKSSKDEVAAKAAMMLAANRASETFTREGSPFDDDDVRRPRFEQRVDRVFAAMYATVTHRARGSELLCEKLGIHKHAIDTLHEAEKALDPRYRAVIEYLYYKDMGYVETTEAFKTTTSSLRTVETHALAALGAYLRNAGIDSAPGSSP